jgi:hypothetical protein
MNTASLQFEGLYAALAALIHGLRNKAVMAAEEIDAALGAAEEKITGDPARRNKLSDANRVFLASGARGYVVRYRAGFASNASARAVPHALATADRYFSFTFETQPALSTKLPRLQELSFFSSTSWSGCCSAFKTHTGVSARTVASCALVVAIFPAVPPVTQPPQLNPIMIAATAPPMAPHIAGFTDADTCIAKLLL